MSNELAVEKEKEEKALTFIQTILLLGLVALILMGVLSLTFYLFNGSAKSLEESRSKMLDKTYENLPRESLVTLEGAEYLVEVTPTHTLFSYMQEGERVNVVAPNSWVEIYNSDKANFRSTHVKYKHTEGTLYLVDVPNTKVKYFETN